MVPFLTVHTGLNTRLHVVSEGEKSYRHDPVCEAIIGDPLPQLISYEAALDPLQLTETS